MYNELIVKNSKNRETIYLYLKRNGFSENYVKNLRKKEGYIKLNNNVAFTNAFVKDGDVLSLFKNPSSSRYTATNNQKLDIVYEDNDILVVNKPSGVATVPSRLHSENNLVGAINNYMFKKDKDFVVRIINRLDKETAGLICVAKHSLIANLLNNNCIKKTYIAVCSGLVKNTIIDKPIETTKNMFGYNNQKREISENGKNAKTHVFCLEFNGENSLCEFVLEHGRTHQIRLHMASIGHPLIGDKLYGCASDLINHTALACLKMEIYNPLSKTNINLKVDMPKDMQNAFKTN